MGKPLAGKLGRMGSPMQPQMSQQAPQMGASQQNLGGFGGQQMSGPNPMATTGGSQQDLYQQFMQQQNQRPQMGASQQLGGLLGSLRPQPPFNASAAYQDFGRELKGMIDSGQLTLEQANALKAPAFEATRLRDVGQQQQAMQAALAAARGRMVPPVAQPQMPMAGPGGGNRDFYDRQVSPEQRARNEAGMADGSYAAYYQQATGQPLQQQPLQQQPMQQMPLRAPQQVRPEPPRMQAMRGIQKMANRQRGFR